MPSVAYFGFFAALFTLFAVAQLCWPKKVKQIFDNLARVLGTEKFVAGYGTDYYRAIGGIYAACAIIMTVMAILTACSH